MTSFETQPDTLTSVGNDDLLAAMRAEIEDLMRQRFGSVDRFFLETGIDKRNFYKVMGRSPQTLWLQRHLDLLGTDLGTYFDNVLKRRQGAQ